MRDFGQGLCRKKDILCFFLLFSWIFRPGGFLLGNPQHMDYSSGYVDHVHNWRKKMIHTWVCFTMWIVQTCGSQTTGTCCMCYIVPEFTNTTLQWILHHMPCPLQFESEFILFAMIFWYKWEASQNSAWLALTWAPVQEDVTFPLARLSTLITLPLFAL